MPYRFEPIFLHRIGRPGSLKNEMRLKIMDREAYDE